MKNIFIFSILYLFLFLGNKKDVLASYIQYPVDYGVYQRNGNDFNSTAIITFVGTLVNPTNAKFKIEKLDQFGTYKSMEFSERNISGNTNSYTVDNIPHPISGGESYHYRFKLTIKTGWYRITIKDGNNTTFSRKFGVGEVFVIAGQSNAQGEGSATNIGTERNYDCVVAAKGGIGTFGSGEVDHSYIFGGGIYMGTLHSDGKIFPNGSKAWFYQELGNKIASGNSNPPASSLAAVVPVAFFNCARSGTSMQNWKESKDRVREIHNNAYSNPIVSNWSSNDPTIHIPWGFPVAKSRVYFGLQSILSYCGNMFGVRAVLWHQGEAETKMLLSKQYSFAGQQPKMMYTLNKSANNDQEFSFYNGYNINVYSDNLQAVIADTRSILGNNLLWAIGKVSYITESYSEFSSSTVDNRNVIYNSQQSIKHYGITSSSGNLKIDEFFTTAPQAKTFTIGNSVVEEQESLVNNSANNIVWASTVSDDQKKDKRSDGTHFNSAGLAAMASDYYSKMPTIFSKSPVLPRAIPRISFSQSGSVYTLTHTNDYPMSYYVWGTEFYMTTANQNSTLTRASNQTFCCFSYAKDSQGRVYISDLVNAYGGGSARVAVTEKSTAFPNPVNSNNTLNLDVESLFEDKITILITDEKGNQLDQIDEHNVPIGLSHYEIDLTNLKLQNQYDVLYVKVIKSNATTTHRILVKK